MELIFKNNNIYYYHYKIFIGQLSWVLVPIILIIIYYFNAYIKYVSLIFLLIGIIGSIESYYTFKKEKLLGILITGLIMHVSGFYPLLNVKKHFDYNNIIYVFGLIALAITYYLPYWPYIVSRKVVIITILALYASYTLYHSVRYINYN